MRRGRHRNAVTARLDRTLAGAALLRTLAWRPGHSSCPINYLHADRTTPSRAGCGNRNLFAGLTRSAPAPQAEAASANALSFRITFGERQEIPRDYSGSISLSSGEVARLSPWRFFDDDEIDGRSGWTLKTKRARFESQPDQARFMSTSVQIENVVPAGIVATVDAPASATAKISTSRGDFDVRLSELIYDRVLSFLEGDVVVQRTPAANQISEPSTVSDGEHSDYPSVTTANDGAVWVAWQSYQDKGDHVFARHSTATGWSNTFRLTDEKTDVYRTAIAADIQGRVWVVWSERSGQKWDLHARRLQGGAWTSRQTLTSANHPNIFHRMVADSAGNLHLVGGGQQQTTRVPILAARGLLILAEYSVVFGRSECLAGAGAARCAPTPYFASISRIGCSRRRKWRIRAPKCWGQPAAAKWFTDEQGLGTCRLWQAELLLRGSLAYN